MNKIKYILGFVFLAGCSSDPFVGNWIGTSDPSTVNLTFEHVENDKYIGSGHAYVCYINSNSGFEECDLCSFNLNGALKDDRNMTTVWSSFGSGVCSDSITSGIMCSVSFDNENLSCQVPEGDLISYYRDQ